MDAPADLRALLLLLADRQIDFVVVGGIAAVLNGVPLATFDLDVVHCRSEDNVERIVALLELLDASSRLHPKRDALRPGSDALAGPGHQLLRTSLGPLDLLGTVEGGLSYEDLLPLSEKIALEGRSIRVLTLPALADLKKNASHPKDQLSRLLILETIEALKGNDYPDR